MHQQDRPGGRPPVPYLRSVPLAASNPQPVRGFLQSSWAGPSRKYHFLQTALDVLQWVSPSCQRPVVMGVVKGQAKTRVTVEEEQRKAGTRRCVLGAISKPELSRAPSRGDSCQGHCPVQNCVGQELVRPESFPHGRYARPWCLKAQTWCARGTLLLRVALTAAASPGRMARSLCAVTV